MQRTANFLRFLCEISSVLHLNNILSLGFSPQHELLHHLRLIVREEEAVLQVESGDASHLVCRQFEVEDVEVLLHTLLVSALRDDDDTTLNQESQCCLGESLAMRLAYLCEHLIGKHPTPMAI